MENIAPVVAAFIATIMPFWSLQSGWILSLPIFNTVVAGLIFAAVSYTLWAFVWWRLARGAKISNRWRACVPVFQNALVLKIGRLSYWWVFLMLANIIVNLALGIAVAFGLRITSTFGVQFLQKSMYLIGIVQTVFLFYLWARVSVFFKKSPWFGFVALIPIVNIVYLVYLAFLPRVDAANVQKTNPPVKKKVS